MEFKYKDFADFLKQKKYGELKDLTEEQAIAHQGEFLKEMRDHMVSMQEKALKESDEAAQKELKEKMEAMEKAITSTVNAQVEKMLKQMEVSSESLQVLLAGKSIEVTLSPFEKAIDDNMEAVKSGKDQPHNEQRTFIVPIEKTAFTAASVTGNTDALRLSSIGQLAHRNLSIWNSLPKIPMPKGANGTVRYTDWDAATTVRAAAKVAEGGAFPESTAVFEEFSLSLQKVGDTIPMTEESLYDRARFTAELNLFIQTNIDLVSDTQAYSGSGAGNNMTGFNTTAIAFIPVASGIPDASIYDLMVKVKEVMVTGKNSKYMPNVAYMNMVDINGYKLKKDANNNYVMPPFVDASGNVIDGVTVIESNAVTSNTLTMADSRYVRVYEEPGLKVSTGLVNDQFAKDLITLKGRRRANVLVRDADRQGVYKVTDIAAALVTLAL